MPMSHRTQMQLIKRRLVGKEGSARTRELRAILNELPGYRNGPYADLRKWVQGQIEATQVRNGVVQRDSLAVRREGAAQVALVGPPNAGKSSLLHALSHVQIKIGNYAFTTVRPVPALTRIHDVPVQIVEIPGLLAGAADDRGGGRALLGVLRGADVIVYCHEATAPVTALWEIRAEVRRAGIEAPALLALLKMDEGTPDTRTRVQHGVPDLPIITVSVLDDTSLEHLKDAIWGLTGLSRVFLRTQGAVDEQPLAVHAGTTVVDVAASIHKDIASRCRGARVWGASARFPGQTVGRNHTVCDGDVVEIIH
ncbi:MAG: hypothetical protein NVS2B16_11690 [Chloroflexota bacterium]